jgi:DNA-binding SARP family transcriptional activator
MEFRVLGPLEVRHEGHTVDLRGSKRRAVLALLVLHANEVVRSDRLIEELWGEAQPANASAALHNHVSRLRKDLGDVLVTKPWGYVLRADPGAIDLRRFELLVAEAKPLAANERRTRLAEALALWRGPALADLDHEQALTVEIARLEELRLSALEQRIDADLELGEHEALIPELEALIGEHPLRERLRGQLILALYRSGRQAEALETYRETRRVLVEELGIEPSPELRELERAILCQDPVLASAPPRPGPAGEEPPVSGWRWPRSPLAVSLGVLLLVGAGLAAALVATRGGVSHPAALAAPPSPATTSASRYDVTTTRSRQRQRQKAAKPHVHRATHGTSPSLASHQSQRPRKHTATRPVAVTSTRTKPPPPPPPPLPARPYRIADDFVDDTMDWTIWHQITSGTGISIGQPGDRLEIDLQPDGEPGGTWNTLSAHYGTQCRFPADFDARVDYTLLDWPTGSGVFVELDAFFGNANVARQSTAQWGENYSSWVQPQNASFRTTDTSGSLRVARVAGTIITYVWHNGRWLKMASGRSTTTVIIGPHAQAQAADWMHKHVRVAFDNFVATAKRVDCPPGSLPPRA